MSAIGSISSANTMRLNRVKDNEGASIQTADAIKAEHKETQWQNHNDKEYEASYFANISTPTHIRDIFENLDRKNKLGQIQEQDAISLSGYGEARGATFPDGSQAALLQLEQAQILYLEDANGNKSYYLVRSNGQISEELDANSATIIVGGPTTPSLTINIDTSGNLTVDGLTPQFGLDQASATFDSQTGRLVVSSYPEDELNPVAANNVHVNVWHDPDLPPVREANNRKLNTVREQNVTSLSDNVTLNTSEFLDGSRAALITVSGTDVFMIENATGEKRYYHVKENGEVGAPIKAGSFALAGGPNTPPVYLLLQNSGGLRIYTSPTTAGSPFNYISLNAETNTITTTSFPAGYSRPDLSSTNKSGVWNGTLLQNDETPGNDKFTTAELYNYYSNTPEGQTILANEGAYFTPVEEVDQRLFIARVLYNREQGGVEVFAEFTPDRTALLNDPEGLAAYDLQFDRALAHVVANSNVSETGEQLDPSLQFILASSITEAIGYSPELMDAVLEDIEKGWAIDYAADYGGWYSATGKISVRLRDFLKTFVRPEQLYVVMPHELAHSLDSYKGGGIDGIPTGMSPADTAILISERDKLFAVYESGGGTSGFRNYAFRDDSPAEFWGEISTYYLSGETTARVVWEASPELFDVVQQFYGLDYDFT